MSPPTLTKASADYLYRTGKAFLEGAYGLVTRQAIYSWDRTQGHYERVAKDLRLNHRIGARWDGRQHRFVACTCAHCQKYPEVAAAVDIY